MELQLTTVPISKTAMLIRKPPAEVYEAFVNPAITTRFWFTKSTGRLEVGIPIEWKWEMYNISSQVDVKALNPGKHILLEWSSGGAPTTVEWIFTPYGEDSTLVAITHSGFTGDADKLVDQAMDSVGGFTLVLAGLKGWIEHGIELNLVADRFPDANVKYQGS